MIEKFSDYIYSDSDSIYYKDDTIFKLRPYQLKTKKIFEENHHIILQAPRQSGVSKLMYSYSYDCFSNGRNVLFINDRQSLFSIKATVMRYLEKQKVDTDRDFVITDENNTNRFRVMSVAGFLLHTSKNIKIFHKENQSLDVLIIDNAAFMYKNYLYLVLVYYIKHYPKTKIILVNTGTNGKNFYYHLYKNKNTFKKITWRCLMHEDLQNHRERIKEYIGDNVYSTEYENRFR